MKVQYNQQTFFVSFGVIQQIVSQQIVSQQIVSQQIVSGVIVPHFSNSLSPLKVWVLYLPTSYYSPTAKQKESRTLTTKIKACRLHNSALRLAGEKLDIYYAELTKTGITAQCTKLFVLRDHTLLCYSVTKDRSKFPHPVSCRVCEQRRQSLSVTIGLRMRRPRFIIGARCLLNGFHVARVLQAKRWL